MYSGVLKYPDFLNIMFFRVFTKRPKLGVFSNFSKYCFLFHYYSACKKATAMVFIGGDKGYPAVRFEYKAASDQYLVAEI